MKDLQKNHKLPRQQLLQRAKSLLKKADSELVRLNKLIQDHEEKRLH